jgi:phytanoyl-CoA hydroxylase
MPRTALIDGKMAGLESLRRTFAREGYVVARRLFPRKDVEFYKRHYRKLVPKLLKAAPAPAGRKGALEPVGRSSFFNVHRTDEATLRLFLDERIAALAAWLSGREHYGVMSAVRFKPPMTEGLPYHYDNSYFRLAPGPCLTACLALDPCTRLTGCMSMAPGTQAAPEAAVRRLAGRRGGGARLRHVVMAPGDVLFLNGDLVHKSLPNLSTRFRRTFFGWYAPADARQMEKRYFPPLRLDGAVAEWGARPV